MLRKGILAATIFLSSCNSKCFVVRHTEKEAAYNMTSDVPLSAAGKERAAALKEVLSKKRIGRIFSTATDRTRATARPLSTLLGVPVQEYRLPDTAFIRLLKTGRENTLVVGHSNTVDDLVNGLLGTKRLSDLPEGQYGDLFVVVLKKKQAVLRVRHFGK